MNKKQIVEFLNRLRGKEGCNFRGKGKNLKWACDAKTQTLSRKILTTMKISKAEQDKFLKRCEKYGGYCDCEILFNAEEKLVN